MEGALGARSTDRSHGRGECRDRWTDGGGMGGGRKRERGKERRESKVVVVVRELGRETTGDYRQRSKSCHVS